MATATSPRRTAEGFLPRHRWTLALAIVGAAAILAPFIVPWASPRFTTAGVALLAAVAVCEFLFRGPFAHRLWHARDRSFLILAGGVIVAGIALGAAVSALGAGVEIAEGFVFAGMLVAVRLQTESNARPRAAA